jgi:hypothetical protein
MMQFPLYLNPGEIQLLSMGLRALQNQRNRARHGRPATRASIINNRQLEDDLLTELAAKLKEHLA